ncbi:hypothetical protein NE237_029944 [Protea cynaroides]|uniref:pectinesterase n=1 Tax=Protea cynaroides TaxID=273540 RepID=A0A9Q0GW85_9MAGN|nr:hypothetical protein NE237_029944 [Protea cynaroides]
MDIPWNSYGKLDEAEQARLEARRRARKRIIIITISSIVLVGIIVGAVLGATTRSGDNSSSSSSNAGAPPTVPDTLRAACKLTLYPDSCYTSLYSMVNSSTIDPQTLAKLSVQVAMTELSQASDHVSQLKSNGQLDQMSAAALQDCVSLMDLAMDHLNDTLNSSNMTALPQLDDLRTWLSTAGTSLHTCLDGLQYASPSVQAQVAQYTQNSTQFISNSLALVTAISNLADSIKMRRLMSVDEDGLPDWMNAADRKLLQKSGSNIKPDLIVARDGSSKYKSINAALTAVPSQSNKRTVIYVKKGVYYEKVIVPANKWNVMMIGDGKAFTVVSGKLNVVDGTPTYSSASFVSYSAASGASAALYDSYEAIGCVYLCVFVCLCLFSLGGLPGFIL